MKRITSLMAGGLLSFSLIAAGSPAAHAVTAPTTSPISAEAYASAKNRVKVTLVHDDNDGRVSAGARTVLKGKVTGERAGQVVYLEEKVTTAGKSRWKVIDRIRHNGRFSFTVAPEHGSHEFRARVRTKGVKGTGPVMTRSKVAAPAGGDATSGSVSVDAATVYGLYVQNSTAAVDFTKARNFTLNYGFASRSGATAPQKIEVEAGDGSRSPGVIVKVRVPQDAVVAWSITAESGIPFVNDTYYPDSSNSNCPAGLFTDSSVPFASIVVTNPNEFGYMAHLQTKAGSCDVPLYSKDEGAVARVVNSVESWCAKSTGLTILCDAVVAVGVAAAIYFSGGEAGELAAQDAAGEAGEAVEAEAQTLFDIDAQPIDRAMSLPDPVLQNLLGEDAEIAVNDNGIVEGWADNDEDLGQGFDEDDEPFNPVPVEQSAADGDALTLWQGSDSSDLIP